MNHLSSTFLNRWLLSVKQINLYRLYCSDSYCIKFWNFIFWKLNGWSGYLICSVFKYIYSIQFQFVRRTFIASSANFKCELKARLDTRNIQFPKLVMWFSLETAKDQLWLTYQYHPDLVFKFSVFSFKSLGKMSNNKIIKLYCMFGIYYC